MRKLLFSMVVSLLFVLTFAGGLLAAQDPIASYDFSAGKGNVLKDVSGNGNDGAINGAAWVKINNGYALKFDGIDDFVDCGTKANLNGKNQVTLEVWAKPFGSLGGEPGIVGSSYDGYMLTTYRGAAWWYISGGSNNINAQLVFETDDWRYVVGTFDGKLMKIYVDGRLMGQKESIAKSIMANSKFLIGCIMADKSADDAAYHKSGYFSGLISSVKVYDRPLTDSEIQTKFKDEAKNVGKDTSWVNKIKFSIYPYPDEGKVLASANLENLFVVPENGIVQFTLVKSGQTEPIVKQVIEVLGKKKIVANFPLTDLKDGKYEIKVALLGKDGIVTSEKADFSFPIPAAKVPSPKKIIIPAIAKKVIPSPYKVDLTNGGGFNIKIGGKTYPIESSFSYPESGNNVLAANGNMKNEAGWTTSSRKVSDSEYQINAEGAYYSINRTIKLEKNRIYVTDKISNKSADAVGIIVRNQLNTSGKDFDAGYLGGRKAYGYVDLESNPSVFVGKKGLGIGLVALDDVFWVQCKGLVSYDMASINTESFAIDKGASYTMEWAIYPTKTGDYYDFINQVRRDENRNGSLAGGLAFITKSPKDRRMVVSNDWTKMHNVAYGAIHCLSFAADDPEVSIEGIEFIDFPKEMDMLKRQMADIRTENPDMNVMFHIAHSLYVVNKNLFPDSEVVLENGKPAIWVDPDFRYISKQRQDEGWAWRIYYPTLDNSFGKALLKSADIMMDDMKANGAFMDGFMRGYVSNITYDKWDGYSADIDLNTGQIIRKKGNVLLLSQDALAEFTRRIKAKGGIVVANNNLSITRTIAKEGIITNREVYEGPEAHLEPTPMCLANPSVVEHQEDQIITDIRNKLRWGQLFCYYETGDITRPSVPEQMYPIIFEELHSGYILGKERLITMNPGVYGWNDDNSLHFSYLYDGRGVLIANGFVTTIDKSGVRTSLPLIDEQTAVVKKVPVYLDSASAVNVIFGKYDSDSIALSLNGSGKIVLKIKTGDFKINDGSTYNVWVNGKEEKATTNNGFLVINLNLKGQTDVVVKQ